MAHTLLDFLDGARACTERGLTLLDRKGAPTRVSWAELVTLAEETAGALQTQGLQPGQRVAIILPTGLDFFAAFFGAIFAGAVPVPLYPPVRLGRIDEYLKRTAVMLQVTESQLLITEPRIKRILGELLSSVSLPLGCCSVRQLSPGAWTEPPRDPESLAFIQFSSGTTVDPKPVALTHRAVTAQSLLIREALLTAWPEREDFRHVCVSWLPLYHDMGLIGCVLPTLEHRADLVLMGPEVFIARPQLWLQAVSRYRGTISPAPNFAYALCVDRVKDKDLEGVDLSSWKVTMNGAEPVAPRTLQRFVDRFARWGLPSTSLSPVYGLSEASLAVTFSSFTEPFQTRSFDRDALSQGRVKPSESGVELVSLGGPLPGFELEIRDPEGRALAEGSCGQLWTRGPSLMREYLGRPDATRAALVEGWLNTGDVGFLWEDVLYLTGRARDLILLKGRNYAPQDLEQAIDGVPGVRTGCSAAVSWRPEEAETELLALFVESRAESKEDADLLTQRCAQVIREQLGLSCDLVVPLEPGTLPRTSSGKIRRAVALSRYLEGTLTPPERVTPLFIARVLARSGWSFLSGRGSSAGG